MLLGAWLLRLVRQSSGVEVLLGAWLLRLVKQSSGVEVLLGAWLLRLVLQALIFARSPARARARWWCWRAIWRL